jgi:hypothetical protein
MAPSSQKLEPPAIPGRFSFHTCADLALFNSAAMAVMRMEILYSVEGLMYIYGANRFYGANRYVVFFIIHNGKVELKRVD